MRSLSIRKALTHLTMLCICTVHAETSAPCSRSWFSNLAASVSRSSGQADSICCGGSKAARVHRNSGLVWPMPWWWDAPALMAKPTKYASIGYGSCGKTFFTDIPALSHIRPWWLTVGRAQCRSMCKCVQRSLADGGQLQRTLHVWPMTRDVCCADCMMQFGHVDKVICTALLQTLPTCNSGLASTLLWFLL